MAQRRPEILDKKGEDLGGQGMARDAQRRSTLAEQVGAEIWMMACRASGSVGI